MLHCIQPCRHGSQSLYVGITCNSGIASKLLTDQEILVDSTGPELNCILWFRPELIIKITIFSSKITEFDRADMGLASMARFIYCSRT